MSEDLEYWKNRCAALNLCDPAVRWALVNAGSVFMGGKSGELLNLDLGQFEQSATQSLRALHRLVRTWGLRLATVHARGLSRKIVIYDPRAVQRDLSAVPGWALRRLGYPASVDAGEFFRRIRARWRMSGAIPHEIGFGLGYPCKDVLGFMGLVSLDQTAECGWRVYGNPRPSLERGARFARARALACACIA